ncbi:hypothetical protein, partial [Rathayibacter sp. PhB179]|uniref:hypothetical protein n=1 Tax=Rathayibacter sp. PhB179 TaxID=2485197 RepID=UPI001A9F0ED5
HDTTIFEPHPPSHKQFSLTTETRSGFAARYAAPRLLDHHEWSPSEEVGSTPRRTASVSC